MRRAEVDALQHLGGPHVIQTDILGVVAVQNGKLCAQCKSAWMQTCGQVRGGVRRVSVVCTRRSSTSKHTPLGSEGDVAEAVIGIFREDLTLLAKFC